MFYNDEKNREKPENVSEKSCDLENPHVCAVYALKIRVLSL
jgi:hypothetical protein